MTSSFDVCVCKCNRCYCANLWIYYETSSCCLHQVQAHFCSSSFSYQAASLVLLDKGQVLVDIVCGADHEGHPLVQRLRLDVQDPLGACGGQASRLLDEEGNGVALIQQPQLWREQPGVISFSIIVLVQNNNSIITYFMYHYYYHHFNSRGVSDCGCGWVSCDFLDIVVNQLRVVHTSYVMVLFRELGAAHFSFFQTSSRVTWQSIKQELCFF